MKRRAFLGFMGGAAAGGRQIVAKAIEGADARLISGIAPMGNGIIGGQIGLGSYSTAERVADIQKSIAGMLTNRAKLLAAARRDMSGNRHLALSPNVHALRSVSLTAKIAMQIDADCEKSVDGRRHWLQVELDELLGANLTS